MSRPWTGAAEQRVQECEARLKATDGNADNEAAYQAHLAAERELERAQVRLRRVELAAEAVKDAFDAIEEFDALDDSERANMVAALAAELLRADLG